jgi:hypothetical protein
VGPRLVVEPASFEAASAAIGLEIAGRVQRAALGLLDGLAGSGGMAGSGPAGARWASAYDDSARLALATTQDVVNGCYQLAALLQQTGFNYSRAESSSTPGGYEPMPDMTAYATCSVQLGRPPSASGPGGGGLTPPGWSLIEHGVRYLWPDGDQGRLRAAAAAWTAAALAIGDATLFVQDALECIAAQVTPELDAAMAACRAMDRHLWELIAGYRDLAGTCSRLAECIDRAHSEIEHELISLAEWTIGIQASGALLAWATFGISEIGAQSGQQARITATAIKVAAIIEELIAAAGAVAESISAMSARMVTISRDVNPLLTARIVVASTQRAEALPAMAAEARAVQELTTAAAEADSLPALTTTRAQIERKYKHAIDFGVTEPKSAAAYKAFAEEVDRFVSASTTTRVFGTYRGKPVVLNYDAATHLVVVQAPSGTFISGWKMYEKQLRAVIERRSLGLE